MNLSDDVQIVSSLTSAHQLRTSVRRTAKEFKALRQKLLENLQDLKSKHVRILVIFFRSHAINVFRESQRNLVDRRLWYGNQRADSVNT